MEHGVWRRASFSDGFHDFEFRYQAIRVRIPAFLISSFSCPLTFVAVNALFFRLTGISDKNT